MRKVRGAVHADLADVEDACAFAWVQFFRYQPDRQGEWRSWLFRTAQREAWRLNARHRTLIPSGSVDFQEPGQVYEPADPRDVYQERLEFQAALEELDKLPEHLRAVVLIHSQVRRHADIAEVLGVSPQRVGYLLQQVGVAVRELAERRTEADRPVASPRAARLRELQDHPPDWLVDTIGRVPLQGKSNSAAILAWRRAALAIDDYRHLSGWSSPADGMGPTPIDPPARRAHQRAERTIARLQEERQRRHSRARGR